MSVFSAGLLNLRRRRPSPLRIRQQQPEFCSAFQYFVRTMPIPVSSDRAIPIPQTSLLSFARFMMSRSCCRCGLRKSPLPRCGEPRGKTPVLSLPPADSHKSFFFSSRGESYQGPRSDRWSGTAYKIIHESNSCLFLLFPANEPGSVHLSDSSSCHLSRRLFLRSVSFV